MPVPVPVSSCLPAHSVVKHPESLQLWFENTFKDSSLKVDPRRSIGDGWTSYHLDVNVEAFSRLPNETVTAHSPLKSRRNTVWGYPQSCVRSHLIDEDDGDIDLDPSPPLKMFVGSGSPFEANIFSSQAVRFTPYNGSQAPSPALKHATSRVREALPDREVAKDLSRPAAPFPGPSRLSFAEASSQEYKKLMEPLSDWVAEYAIAATRGLMSVAIPQIGDLHHMSPSSELRSSLAARIKSLFSSTLLSPSAIFLSLHYLSRLPVSVGPLQLLNPVEQEFRAQLLQPLPGQTRDSLLVSTPFRVVILGFMLANKWLDDHTFSNKTWHSITNVTSPALNHLERKALILLNHDLSIDAAVWSQWMDKLRVHHKARAPYPAPIGRPSSDAYLIVRQAMDKLMVSVDNHAQPVFLGLAARVQETHETYTEALVKDIDLDEDGPLREEYIPRRRQASSPQPIRQDVTTQIRATSSLPPPARWSPQADPLIQKSRPRYEAVQPLTINTACLNRLSQPLTGILSDYNAKPYGSAIHHHASNRLMFSASFFKFPSAPPANLARPLWLHV